MKTIGVVMVWGVASHTHDQASGRDLSGRNIEVRTTKASIAPGTFSNLFTNLGSSNTWREKCA
jgi:hypothetical protein